MTRDKKRWENKENRQKKNNDVIKITKENIKFPNMRCSNRSKHFFPFIQFFDSPFQLYRKLAAVAGCTKYFIL